MVRTLVLALSVSTSVGMVAPVSMAAAILAHFTHHIYSAAPSAMVQTAVALAAAWLSHLAAAYSLSIALP